MNRAREELLSIVSAIDLQAETMEREAARLRWKPEIELDVLALRNEAAFLRREGARR